MYVCFNLTIFAHMNWLWFHFPSSPQTFMWYLHIKYAFCDIYVCCLNFGGGGGGHCWFFIGMMIFLVFLHASSENFSTKQGYFVSMLLLGIIIYSLWWAKLKFVYGEKFFSGYSSETWDLEIPNIFMGSWF